MSNVAKTADLKVIAEPKPIYVTDVPIAAHVTGMTRSHAGSGRALSSNTPNVKMVVGQGVTPKIGARGQACPSASPSALYPSMAKAISPRPARPRLSALNDGRRRPCQAP